jgi:hypothetical protein
MVLIPIFLKLSARLGPTDFINCTDCSRILSSDDFIALKIIEGNSKHKKFG